MKGHDDLAFRKIIHLLKVQNQEITYRIDLPYNIELSYLVSPPPLNICFIILNIILNAYNSFDQDINNVWLLHKLTMDLIVK